MTDNSLETTLRWLDTPGGAGAAVTWGTPWPKGAIGDDTIFALVDAEGRRIPSRSWITATWPDGSVKWTGHDAVILAESESFRLLPVDEPDPVPQTVAVDVDKRSIVIDTGPLRANLRRTGPVLVDSLERDGRTVATSGRFVSARAEDPDGRDREILEGVLEDVVVEHQDDVRVVLLARGRHVGARREWLPFRVRLSFFAGSDQVKIVHSIVWDGDPEHDFLCALGLRFDVALDAPLHDRHVRLAGSSGFFTEAVRPVTGLWRDPGPAARNAQVTGRDTGPTSEWATPATYLNPAPTWSERLEHVPAWSDFRLTQLSPDGYTLKKRTNGNHGWIGVPGGTRSRGYAYLGQPTGGLEVGMRGFWQSYPTQLDVAGATSTSGSITVWMWSPDAPPMDVRFYHDGEHEQDHAGQHAALEVTYEDYKPGFGNAHGVGRTHELVIRAVAGTPDADELQRHAQECVVPPQLVVSNARLRAAGVFGAWNLPDDTTPTARDIEARLRGLVDYYADQVEERRWYGFWDYGDVMHAYDSDRHTWRYDIGGYAWDNSELSTDQWLWMSFLRTGDARTFRLAEAMTRHTGEVDVYHSGEFAGFGTRHNVQHWGCSCKQLRISNPLYRRYLYFLTADERLGELMDEVDMSDDMLVALDHNRSVGSRQGERPGNRRAAEVDLGIDYGAMLASWLTRWERYGDPRARQRIVQTLSDIGAMPRGFFTGVAHLDVSTGRFDVHENRQTISHLSAVFGIVETIHEILDLVDVPEFERAWLDYCEAYLAPPERQIELIGEPWDGALKQAHSRLLAWAAARTGRRDLAERAWEVFLNGSGDRINANTIDPVRRERPPLMSIAEPVTELPGLFTNDAAQYSLAAFMNLALISDHLPDAAQP